jgi:hypothetical protein
MKQEKSQKNGRIGLSEEKVRDITFFETDLVEMSKQLNSAEKLYNNLYEVYSNLTGGKYVSMKSPRDIAEIAKALVQMRSLCSDTAFKRHQIRKNLSDIVYKNNPQSQSMEEDFIKDTARTILNEVRTYMDNVNGGNRTNIENGRNVPEDIKEQLNFKVDHYIKNGDIKLSKNDRLIGISNHVEFQYDKGKDSFIAIDERNGEIIDNFPQERLPKSNISRVLDSEVITNSGDSYKIFGE